jgi:hypothetical protein
MNQQQMSKGRVWISIGRLLPYSLAVLQSSICPRVYRSDV